MKTSLRKGYARVHITYRSGKTTALNADNFTLDAREERILLSMDFSHNESGTRKDTNRYLDARELMTKISEIEVLQIHRDRWMTAFGLAIRKHPTALREVELCFRERNYALQVTIKADEHNLFYIPCAANDKGNGRRNIEDSEI